MIQPTYIVVQQTLLKHFSWFQQLQVRYSVSQLFCFHCRRKFSDSEDTAADKSLSTRVQEKASLNSKKILDFEIPKMATRGDQSSPAKNPLSPITGKRNPWLEAEVDDFYQAVLIFGVGNWSQIRDAMKTARTNVQLKDKWRTILKCGEINRLKKQFGDVRK